MPFRKQLVLHRAGGQASAAVLTRTTDPRMAPIPMILRWVRREALRVSSTSAVKIEIPYFHLNLWETIFSSLSTHFPKMKWTYA